MDKNLALMAVGVSTMTSLLLVRSTYRIIELSGGWSGPIISTQWLFSSSTNNYFPPQNADHRSFINADTFDGAMIVLAAFTLNILHPGTLLREYDERVERIEVGAIGQDKIASSPSVQSV
jgi:hypothetical protein